MIEFRPGHNLIIPGVRVLQPRPVSSWWLSGGITSGQCAAAYQPKGAADLADSYINKNAPGTNDAAPGVAPTWDATNGWTGNGTSMYLTTGITPAANRTWSMIVRYTNAQSAKVLCGGRGAATSYYFDLWGNGGDNKVYYGNGTELGVIPLLTSGVLAVAGTQGYRNGVSDGAAIGAGGANAGQVYILAFNAAGTASFFNSGKIQALAIYNITLSAGQVSALVTAINAL